MHDGSRPGHVETLRAELEESARRGDAPVVIPRSADIDETGGGSDDSARRDVIVSGLALRRRRVGRILVPAQFNIVD